MTVAVPKDLAMVSPSSVTNVIVSRNDGIEHAAPSAPSFSSASSTTSSPSSLVHVITHNTTEEFDKEGNVTRVENLIFLEGILGQGAFGTVRLARRKLIPCHAHNSSDSMSESNNHTPSSGQTSTMTTTTTHVNSNKNDDRRRVGQRQPRHGVLSKSVSDPNKEASFFFPKSTLGGIVTISTADAADHTHDSQADATCTPLSVHPAKVLDSSSVPRNTNSSPIRRGTRQASVNSATSLFRHPSHQDRRHNHVQHHNFVRSSPGVGTSRGVSFASAPGFHSFDDRHHHGDDDCDDDEQLVAVKIFSKSLLKRQRTMERDKATNQVKVKTALQQVEREIALMKKLSHPNLVCLYEVIDSPGSDMLYMVLEYMPGGEILTYQDDGTFRRKNPRPNAKDRSSKHVDGIVDGHFDEEHAALYFVDILHALAHLHLHHVCHRDLKPENILLDARGIAKVGDFGVSHIFDKETDVGARRMTSIDELGRQEQPTEKTFNTQNSNESWSGTSLDDASASDRHRTLLTKQDTDAALSLRSMAGLGMLSPHHAVLTREEIDAAVSLPGMPGLGMLSRTEGTWCFWTPAMCAGSKSFGGYTADMWAAGVCLFIFATGKLPFYSEVPSDLFEMISKAELDYSGLGLSNSLVDLLKSCLEKEPKDRAGVGDCLQHPFLHVARETRIRQLGEEFENSNRSKIEISDEDMRLAFRTVTNVPVQVLRSAGKRIQDGFAQTRDRLHLGDRVKSHSSAAAPEGESLVKHIHDSMNPFRSRPHSMGSTTHSVDRDEHGEEKKHLEKKEADSLSTPNNKSNRRHSHQSNTPPKNGNNNQQKVVFCRRNTAGDSDRSLRLIDGLPEGGKSFSEMDRDCDTRTDISRMSLLSSAISFGSAATDDQPRTTLIVGHEQDEEKKSDSYSNELKVVRFETQKSSNKCEYKEHSLGDRHENPLGYEQPAEKPSGKHVDDDQPMGNKKNKKIKRRQSSSSRCTVM